MQNLVKIWKFWKKIREIGKNLEILVKIPQNFVKYTKFG
jgi:hypothetical protein